MAVKKVKGKAVKSKAVSRKSAPIKKKSMIARKKLTGDVYYPSKKAVEEARLKDWDKLAKSAGKAIIDGGAMVPN